MFPFPASLLLLVFLAGAVVFAPQAGATVRVVHIVNTPSGSFTYAPFTAYAATGDTLRWINDTAVSHTATGGTSGPNGGQDPNSPINSPIIGPGGIYDVQLHLAGTYQYFCQIHPDMGGIVRVTTTRVTIQNFAFTPDTINVAVGDTVIWTNLDSFLHTSTSGAPLAPSGTWNSGNLGNGASFQWIANATGSYPYYCANHTFMTGLVNVAATVGVDAPHAAPRTRLLAARPNPARRSVELPFELAQARQIRLLLLDAAGRKVSTLFEGVMPAGLHSVDWNGRTASGRPAAAGIYYYQLSGDPAGRTTRRFTWLR